MNEHSGARYFYYIIVKLRRARSLNKLRCYSANNTFVYCARDGRMSNIPLFIALEFTTQMKYLLPAYCCDPSRTGRDPPSLNRRDSAATGCPACSARPPARGTLRESRRATPPEMTQRACCRFRASRSRCLATSRRTLVSLLPLKGFPRLNRRSARRIRGRALEPRSPP